MEQKTIKRRNRPNRYSDDLLLDAGADVFHRRGFREASMNEIAEEAGVTKPTLYARFGNKETLYDRVMERTAESLMLHMAAAYDRLDGQTTDDAIQLSAQAFFDWVRAHPAGFHLLFADDQGAPTGVDHGDRALATFTEGVTAASARFLGDRGLRAGRANGLIAACAVGLLIHAARWAFEHDASDRLDVGSFSGTFILSGLQGVSPEAIASLKQRKRSA